MNRRVKTRNEAGEIEEVEVKAPSQDIKGVSDFRLFGWSYEKEPPDTIMCNKCGGDRFIVGQNGDALLTVIKCPNCGWEWCIHEG